jgi:hypothetical protein
MASFEEDDRRLELELDERRQDQAVEVLNQAIDALPLARGRIRAILNRSSLIDTLGEAGFLAVHKLDAAFRDDPDFERLLRQKANASDELIESIRDVVRRQLLRTPVACASTPLPSVPASCACEAAALDRKLFRARRSCLRFLHESWDQCMDVVESNRARHPGAFLQVLEENTTSRAQALAAAYSAAAQSDSSESGEDE